MGPAFDRAQAAYDAMEPPDLEDDDGQEPEPNVPESLVIIGSCVHWTRLD